MCLFCVCLYAVACVCMCLFCVCLCVCVCVCACACVCVCVCGGGQVVFAITGFGKFNGVGENPTERFGCVSVTCTPYSVKVSS